MTNPRDPEALLSAYLADGMTVLPDRVADAVLEEVRRTRQRTVFGPWRTRPRFRPSLAAAAVVAVVVSGALLMTRPDQRAIGDPSPTPTVAPSASEPAGPSAGPTSTAVAGPTGAWIATGTMGAPRYGHEAVRLLDGRVLIAGGSNGDENDTSAELYDPDSGTWSATGSMVKPHAVFPATLLRDGRVLVGDIDDPGSDDLASQIAGAEVYDPATGTWTATGKMVWGGGVTATTATLLRDGKVLVTGLRGAELYDPDSGTWTATGKMITPRYNHAAFMLFDGRVLVAGGEVVPDRTVESAELYDPATGTWTAIASNINWRAHHSPATLLRDGKVLKMGMERPELYDPATGAWTATGAMARPGAVYGSATLLSDGMVLVTGDDGAELFDPGTGSWTTTGTMLRPHNDGSTSPLLDGSVLVAGGREDPIGATGAAELYIPAGVSPPPDLAPVPSPTPTPIPTPIPTPFPPEAGPVPAGARSWKVTVRNESSVPATLFLAEDGENGIGQLCGSVTPHVVQARVTQKVTFLLPPKSVTGCWIWMNPVPGQGGSLFETSDAPLAGEIFIQEGGQGGWLSP